MTVAVFFICRHYKADRGVFGPLLMAFKMIRIQATIDAHWRREMIG